MNKIKNKTFVPVVYNCNDNCISCPVSRRYGMENPSLEDIKKEADEILKSHSHIEINGGEPTLRKDLLEILKYIEKKNPHEIGILTNAQSFYYNKFTERISKIKNLKIITTLYGHNPKIQNSIARNPASFKYKIAGIKNLAKNNVKIELRILLHKMNYAHFNEIADFIIDNFESRNFNSIVIMNPKLTGTAGKNAKFVAERITKLSEVLEAPIKKLISKGYKVWLFHFPHCTLPKGLWEYSKGVTADSSSVVFAEKCSLCQKKSECSGIWKSYLDFFGENEFMPVKDTGK
ncbi:radical SAM protein [Candidatus Woesearchaeota archaeon]|nr:radical SAM protein [Candidatus Woesearchaeota archaeon]